MQEGKGEKAKLRQTTMKNEQTLIDKHETEIAKRFTTFAEWSDWDRKSEPFSI